MQSVQTNGIDLPLKTLDSQDASDAARLSHNVPNWLAKRHGVDSEAEAPLMPMNGALSVVAAAATAP